MKTLEDYTKPHCDEPDKQRLSDEERNRIIEQYLPVIQKIAGYVVGNCAHKLDHGDLVNIGVFGLMQAIKNFNPDYHVSFADYCKIRIRGEMLDELRRLNWVPRQIRRDIREVEEAKQKLHLRFNRTPVSEELADELGIPLDALDTRNRMNAYPKIFSLNEMVGHQSDGLEFADVLEDPNSPTPQQTKEARDSFDALLKDLPQTEQLVLFLYYQEELSMYQTGLLLGISESRVCQIHSQAIRQLRTKYHGRVRTSTNPSADYAADRMAVVA